MPVYNVEKFVEHAIQSVLQQTHKDFELVIVDDCSTDKSFFICKKYENHPKVTLLKNEENRGCYYTRNRGLAHFKNKEWDYFTIHDPDDVSDTTRFEKILKEFRENTLGLKSTYLECDIDLNYIKINNKHTYAGEGIAFFKRKVFEEILGYFDNTRFSGDTDYWCRLEAFCKLNTRYSVGESREPLYLRRHHGNNLTSIYDFDTTRPAYYRKIQKEVHEVMLPKKNFYRTYFK